MTKSPILATLALSAVLTVGGLLNAGSASAQAVVCPPNTVCPPVVGTQLPKGTGNTNVPNQTGNQNGQDQAGNQNGQNQTGNMDWKRRHRHGSMGDNQAQNDNGNWNMRHRHDWRHPHYNQFGNSGVNFGLGIYLGGRQYGYYVSCGEARGIVRASGFRNVRTLSCAPGPYHFIASKRGRAVDVAVSRRGRIVAVNRASY